MQDSPLDFIALGDRCKQYEMAENSKLAMVGLPLLVRLDGRAFHTFTRGLKRPYDTDLAQCMKLTTGALVDEFHADVGYTQSDEITLAWYLPPHSKGNTASQYPFNGRFQKLTSVLAGFASAAFYYQALRRIDSIDMRDIPSFDCRVWQVPSLTDAYEVFAWREEDAVKNSIQMLAQAHFTHKELQKKGRKDQLDMLHSKNISWNDQPTHFKRGAYFQRTGYKHVMTPEEIDRIPATKRPEGHEVERTRIEEKDWPPIRRAENPIALLFRKAV